MADCLSGDPVPGDPRFDYANQWQTGMMDDMTRYKCCQGYYDICCFKAGSLQEESCPDVCNALESYFCLSCSISSTRTLVMDTRDIRPDPCDARLIGLSNCLQMAACLCQILAMIMPEFEDIAEIIDFVADIVFALISSCMLAQANLELTSQPRPANWGKMGQYPRGGSKGMRNMQNQDGQGGHLPQQMQMGGGGYGGGG
eukprot:CAMPEP_0173069956 /NCGR_PEP_ID=MMETSP1102-20130122/8324_1 /TAXON_ID=49646 /ORGANISM="Geminigera sp., Strain Caron Lab Isolate" /LENGTH=199 /DNA_ID=CAMNT_0013938121 /DNA_START=17 /DNA_END=614 /DNA_ORIENTATION=+